MGSRNGLLMVVSLVAGAAESRISLTNYIETPTAIRLTVRNNHNARIVFWQVRMQSRCPDGKTVDAGGWSADVLRTLAAKSDSDRSAPIRSEPIEPGAEHDFEFIRSHVVHSEMGECEASALKDLTVIFADGASVGDHALVDAQFRKWRIESAEIKVWLEPLRELLRAEDRLAAAKTLRSNLDENYDDCEGRPLQGDQPETCATNREIRQDLNGLWQTMRVSGIEAAGLEDFVAYWERFSEIVLKQSKQFEGDPLPLGP